MTAPENRRGTSSGRRLEWRLRSPFRRAIFAAAVGLLAIPLAYKSASIGAAAALAASSKQALIATAMRLDPANPGYYEQMGLRAESASGTSSQDAVRWFEKAAELDPRNGSDWEELGEACEIAGEQTCARSAFARAAKLEPMAPRPVWNVANDDLLAGNTGRGIAEFRRLLEIDPSYGGAVFTISLRALGNPEIVAEKVLPGHAAPALRLAFINDLMGQQDTGAANHLWNQLVSSRAAFPFSAADPYLEKLIAAGQIGQAKQVWQDMIRMGTLPGTGWDPGQNAIYNGGFEWNPVKAGFDWRTQHFPYVEAEFGDPEGYRGQRALRIDFTFPENEDSEPVFQLVPVQADRSYRLSAWVRSDDITSDSGPRLRVSDPANPACRHAETGGTTGTTPWHEVSVTFSTCPETQLLRVSMARPRGYDYPHDISGHFWVDDVKLAPLGARNAPAAAEQR